MGGGGVCHPSAGGKNLKSLPILTLSFFAVSGRKTAKPSRLKNKYSTQSYTDMNDTTQDFIE